MFIKKITANEDTDLVRGCTKFNESPDMSVSSGVSLFSPTIRVHMRLCLGDGSGVLCGFVGCTDNLVRTIIVIVRQQRDRLGFNTKPTTIHRFNNLRRL